MFLQVLGFGDYMEEVFAAYEQHKLETVVTFLFLDIHYIVSFLLGFKFLQNDITGYC